MTFLPFNYVAMTCRFRAINAAARSSQLRRFSAIPEYRAFPATLIRLNLGRKSSLYPKGSKETEERRNLEDAVTVSDDGFIRQHVDPGVFFGSNGAWLMPNTFNMQELVRRSVDYYYEDEEAGVPALEPMIFTIAKGTQVPDALSLLREESSQFSLQPREPMPLHTLNGILDDFYESHAVEQTADKWLDEHDYAEAFDDFAEETWMAV